MKLSSKDVMSVIRESDASGDPLVANAITNIVFGPFDNIDRKVLVGVVLKLNEVLEAAETNQLLPPIGPLSPPRDCIDTAIEFFDMGYAPFRKTGIDRRDILAMLVIHEAASERNTQSVKAYEQYQHASKGSPDSKS